MRIWDLPTPKRTINAIAHLLEEEISRDQEVMNIGQLLIQYLRLPPSGFISLEVTTVPSPYKNPPCHVVAGRGIGWDPDNGGIRVLNDITGSNFRIITDWTAMFGILLRRRRVRPSPMYPDGYIHEYDMLKAYRQGLLYYASDGQVEYWPVMPYLFRLKRSLETRAFPRVLGRLTSPRSEGGLGVKLVEPEDDRYSGR